MLQDRALLSLGMGLWHRIRAATRGKNKKSFKKLFFTVCWGGANGQAGVRSSACLAMKFSSLSQWLFKIEEAAEITVCQYLLWCILVNCAHKSLQKITACSWDQIKLRNIFFRFEKRLNFLDYISTTKNKFILVTEIRKSISSRRHEGHAWPPLMQQAENVLLNYGLLWS